MQGCPAHPRRAPPHAPATSAPAPPGAETETGYTVLAWWQNIETGDGDIHPGRTRAEVGGRRTKAGRTERGRWSGEQRFLVRRIAHFKHWLINNATKLPSRSNLHPTANIAKSTGENITNRIIDLLGAMDDKKGIESLNLESGGPFHLSGNDMSLLNALKAVAKPNTKKVNTLRVNSTNALAHLNIYTNHLKALGETPVKDYSIADPTDPSCTHGSGGGAPRKPRVCDCPRDEDGLATSYHRPDCAVTVKKNLKIRLQTYKKNGWAHCGRGGKDCAGGGTGALSRPHSCMYTASGAKITVAPTAPLVKLAARAKAKHKNYEDNKKRAATNEKKKKTKTKKTKTTAGPPSPPPPPPAR